MIVDAHEDIAWNVLTFGRDYTLSVDETRRLEAGSETPALNGDTLLGWPEWVRGRVGLVLATLFATPARRRGGKWDILCYADPDEANRLYRSQLDLYRRMEQDQPAKFRLVTDADQLDQVVVAWQAYSPDPVAIDETGVPDATTDSSPDFDPTANLAEPPPIGLIPLMEGADGIRSPSELAEWHEAGVRILGLAWSRTRYAGGTWEPGGLTEAGFALLEAMRELGMAVDLSHLTEQGAQQVLERYPGPILASHSNARALVTDSPEPERHLSDQLIRSIAERNGVIGVVLYNFFLRGDWRPGDGREAVTRDHIVAQIDHICQLTGSAAHVGIGSDFDGGFGLQGVPDGIDSVADLGFIGEALQNRGYDEQDVQNVLAGNWIRFLGRTMRGAH